MLCLADILGCGREAGACALRNPEEAAVTACRLSWLNTVKHYLVFYTCAHMREEEGGGELAFLNCTFMCS